MKGKLLALVTASLLALALFGVVLWKGVPLLLQGVVRLVPVSWEERLGRSVAYSFSGESALCEDAVLSAHLRTIQDRLEASLGRHPYRFSIRVVRSLEVNALAAPGGYLVIFSGLLDRLDSPEQLAGVLAHEMQHVLQRHSTNSIARALGLQVLLGLVVGDPGGFTGLAGNLGMLHFMRGDERSADEAALENLMRAGIDPKAMIEAFRKLRDGDGGANPALKYLSTHPPLEERIAYLQERAEAWRGQGKPFGFSLSRACAAAR